MATKAFCDKCWSLRVRNNTLTDDSKNMPTLATHSITNDTGSKIDACNAHLLDAVHESLNSLRNGMNECNVRKL